MTRNNLAEHLRWLLATRPAQFASAGNNDNNTLQPPDAETPHINVDEQQYGDDFDDSIVMPTRDGPGRTLVQPPAHLVEIHATSPNVTARSPGRQRAAVRHVRGPTPVPMTVPQTPDAKERFDHTLDDVEILDMTTGLERMLSPSKYASKLTKQTIPRKRKSDEYDDNEQSVPRRQKTPAGLENEDRGPPPPYSTVPPLNLTHGRSVELPASPRQDTQNLFDFSDRRAKERAGIAANVPHTSDSKQALVYDNDDSKERLPVQQSSTSLGTSSAAAVNKASNVRPNVSPPNPPPTSTANTTVHENVVLLKQFFALPSQAVQQINDDLAKQLDTMIDEIALLHDEGGNDEEIVSRESELRALTLVQDAVTTLQKSASKMQWLATKRDEQFANLRTAIRQLNSSITDQAKTANQAAKAELESFEQECLQHLRVCKAEVEQAIAAQKQPTAAGAHVAIEASQHPIRSITPFVRFEDNTARIVQTQAAASRAATSHAALERPPTSFNERSTSRQDNFATDSGLKAPQTSFHDFGIDDDFQIDDDDFCEIDADMIDLAAPVGAQKYRPALKETSVNVKTASSSKGKAAATKHDNSELDSLLFNHAWSNDVKRTLKEQFRLQGFRQGQLEAINATLGGQDTFVLMPTGGGKSLCYQLPSQIRSGGTQGVTVVVSPLLSLMEDQVQHLRRLNIQAFLINGQTSQSERKQIWDTLGRLDVATFVQILYITPEMLSKSQAMINSLNQLYSNKRFARLVIDEAHCVSQWGHDFRPDYTLIGDVRRNYPSVPVMALTATATENVKVDIIHNLGIKGCKVFTRSFNRPNLHYEVREKGKSKDVLANIAALIKQKHNKQTGIVYCLSRKNCEEVAKELREQHKIKAAHYHAGMKADEKSEVQRGWQAGQWHVIVATIAFGMGIDKSNVRFVVHHSVPKSLEGYYQETGRAGRDGGQSYCYLFFSFSDITKLRRMIFEAKEVSHEQKARQHAMLRQMVQYCDNKADCRRVQVLRYFSEVFQKHDCHQGCDVCCSNTSYTMQDVTSFSTKAIDIVRCFDKAKEKVTLLKCVDAFRGSKNVTSNSAAAGSGKELERGDAERLYYALIAEGALEEYQVMNMAKFPVQYIQLGPRAQHFGHIELAMRLSPNAKSKANAKPAPKRTKKAARGASELPLSTNVSSPVQAASKRRKQTVPSRKNTKPSGSRHDELLVADEDEDDEDYETSDSDAFQTMGNKTPPRSGPITTDGTLDHLDHIHQALVEDFVGRAGQKVREIMSRDSLRGALFPDAILRQMAIRFTETPDEMKKIPDIVPSHVDHYGSHFCKLVKQCRQSYEEMTGDNQVIAGTAHNPNGNVIDLCTDEEDNDEEEDEDEDEYGDFDGLDIDEEDLVSSGTARPISAQLAAFNEQFAESQSAANRIKPAAQHKSRSQGKSKKRGWRAVSGGNRGEASARGRGDRSGPAGKRSGGVVKKTAARRSNDGGGRGKSSARSGYISAMPT